MKFKRIAQELIDRSNPYWRPIWSRRVPRGRKLTKAVIAMVARRDELEAELKDVRTNLKNACTHPRDAQLVFEWSTSQQVCTNFYSGWGSDYETVTNHYFEVKCTVCNQIVNDSGVEAKKTKAKAKKPKKKARKKKAKKKVKKRAFKKKTKKRAVKKR